ncbi:MAG TPA: squalene synthase HpnC [Streptosporangiaceae bacterium]|nr:squalene synthase HpnC [Streptosporangiaceae bacterium]
MSDVIAEKAGLENFPVAARVLPARYRRHLLAVYCYARLVDDIGDDAPQPERMRLLDEVDADLDRIDSGATPRLPVLRALAPTVASCAIPIEPFRRLVAANRQDQVVTRYATFADLMAYCELSANPVGQIVLHVFGAATAERVRLSDKICSALQIIEHCQDVGEDYERGRVYLPGDDLRRFGCDETDIKETITPTRLRGVVALEVTRASQLLNGGIPLIAGLTGFAKIAVAGYAAGGRATVAALERGRYDVLGRRLRPGKPRLVREWLRILTKER